jgi:hypothetical protein
MVSSRPQTNEERVLAAQWSDMKDGKTIKEIVPFFFSFGQDKVFCFLFSIAEQKREEKNGRYFLGEFSRSLPVFGLLKDPSRACMLLKSCPLQLLHNSEWAIINTNGPASFVFLFIVFQ